MRSNIIFHAIFPWAFRSLRNVKVVILAHFFLSFCVQLVMAQAIQKDICDEDFSCATDPTYKFFEKEQQKAYCSTERGRDILRLLKDENYRIRIYKQTDSMINSRPNSLGRKAVNDNVANRIIENVMKKKLPTCYEDPGIFLMIEDYMKQIERARKQLKLPLKLRPVYGSLPTSEINAYTYPAVTDTDAVEKRGSVIGFNTQLFMFAYQMPKITLPTVDVSSDKKSNKISINFSRQAALKAIELDSNIAINYSMAILEFLQLTEPSTQPLDSKYDGALMAFTRAIELFAVAHEYGHLIKGHTLQGTKSLRFNSDGADKPTETIVGIRSWQQELEADNIGVQLLIQVLKNEVSDAKPGLDRRATQLRQIFALYGALFYFKCSGIIEDAQYIRDHGTIPPELSLEEIAYIRSVASGKPLGQKDKVPNLTLDSHPPAWVRLELTARAIRQYLKQETFSEEAIQFSRLGLGLIENIDVLRGVTLPRMPMLIDIIKNKRIPTEIGYTRSPEFWTETFLFNPELQEVIGKFNDQNLPDSIIIQGYRNAVKKDWFLLSGVQVKWAEKVINSQEKSNLRKAIIILALSGNKQFLSLLKKFSQNTSVWNKEDQTLLLKAIQFLERNGRESSIKILVNTSADEIELSDLLSFPGRLDKKFVQDSLVPKTVPRDVQRFLAREGSSPDRRSLSALALFFLAAKSEPIEVLNFWTDLLLESDELDAALRYVQAWNYKVGANPASENTIGNILSKKGDLRQAIAHYEESIKLGRTDGWPEINIAMNYSKLNELTQAEEWFRKGINKYASARSQGEYARYLNEFAWFLVTKLRTDKKKSKEALAFSIVSNKLTNYSDPVYLDTLAECLFENGDFKLSVEMSQRALNLVLPNSSEYEEYKKRLEEFKTKVKNQHR